MPARRPRAAATASRAGNGSGTTSRGIVGRTRFRPTKTQFEHVIAVKIVFWTAVGALWTHVGYPVAAAALARLRTRRVRRDAVEPTVCVIVTAYNEEAVIERRLGEPARARLPRREARVVVTSMSTDRTHELVERFAPRVRLIVNDRGGKVAAQNRAVRETGAEIVAFSDANATWAPDALRMLVSNSPIPTSLTPFGRLNLRDAASDNKEGLYWRFETWLRASRRSTRPPAASAPSTRYAGATMSRSTRGSGMTCRFRI